MTDMHTKNGIMIQNMIYEQNMMKFVAGKKDTKFSCFSHKFGTLAAILKWKAAILNDWHAHEEWYYGILYNLWRKYDESYCWEKEHQIMFWPPIWHFGGHFEMVDGHFEWLTYTWRMILWYRMWFMNKSWPNLVYRQWTHDYVYPDVRTDACTHTLRDKSTKYIAFGYQKWLFLL